MYATNYFEEKILNLLRGQNITAPSALYIGLFLTDPTDTGAAGTEISYTGYARQRIIFTAPETDGIGLSIQNTQSIIFNEAASAAGTVSHVGVFDDLTDGHMLLYSQLSTSLNVQNGVAPIFQPGSVKWTWSGGFSSYYRTAVMNTLRGTDLNGFTPYVALCNGNPESGGNELSGGNYARFAVEMSAPVQQVSGAAQTSNTAEATSVAASQNWGILNTVAVYDSATSGKPFAIASLGSTFSMNTGNIFGFHAGDLKISIN